MGEGVSCWARENVVALGVEVKGIWLVGLL